jgi:uncharacterized protein YbjT (DUF2867 family)/ligand-binding SRPBCC domain-containing protein
MTDLRIVPGQTIAVTGSSGYVGGRLVPALLDAGFGVRCLARDPRKVLARPWASRPGVEIVQSSLDDPPRLAGALRGCAGAYYLVHAMVSGGPKFADVDERLARTFGLAAAAAGVGRLVYLGGLGEEADELSEHLASRRNVEKAMREGGVPLTTLRAAMIIGSGSASFEILRYLVERLPVMVTPHWVRTQSQPIAIRDVVRYLVETLSIPETASQTLDIGGPDLVTYRDLMRIMASELGLPRRLVIPVGVLSPGLSSRWIHLVTPIGRQLARPLAEGLRNRMVCRDDRAARLMPGPLLSVREAIQRAVAVHRAGRTPTAWSDAGTMPGDPGWAGGTEFRDERARIAWAPPHEVFKALSRIGGENGYFGSSLLWRLRGALDRMIGGPGLRRGRRDPAVLRYGDALDFWRVAGVEPERSLELVAEMRLPGEARLRWRLEPSPGGRTLIVQTATFRPKGLLGLAYWWAVYPVHGPVFESMLGGLCERAESMGEGAPSRRPRTGVKLLRCETIVSRTLDETFGFFSDARNLDRLTPPWVGFRILTPTPIPMRKGVLIDYRIRVRGVPLRWRTEIEHWDPPNAFADVQALGPYRWWHHTHRFEACPEGTRVVDEVEYRAPLAWLTHPLMINRDVKRIFEHRQGALRQALPPFTPGLSAPPAGAESV